VVDRGPGEGTTTSTGTGWTSARCGRTAISPSRWRAFPTN